VVAVLPSSRQDAKGIESSQLHNGLAYISTLSCCIYPIALDVLGLCPGPLSSSFCALFCIVFAFVHPLSSFPPHDCRSVWVRIVKELGCEVSRLRLRREFWCHSFRRMCRCLIWRTLYWTHVVCLHCLQGKSSSLRHGFSLKPDISRPERGHSRPAVVFESSL
jgi:hypothetical protein